MIPRPMLLALLAGLFLPSARAQVIQDSRFAILRVLIADTAASRIAMPFGSDGVELSETGRVEEAKLAKALLEEGQSIAPGQVVEITAIRFDDDKIEVELDGGGDNGPGILDRIQVGVGGRTTPIRRPDPEPATGSRVVLRFEEKTPAVLSVEDLKEYLSPVLDFNKQNFMDSGIESLPVEFQEAVARGEVKIGMDWSTVLKAMDRPDDKFWETDDAGIEVETWLYRLPGQRVDFIYFEDGIVVKIVHH